ncbi:MAG TPA: hypothetical protein VMX57_03335, partial [Planctomycetota bacterium]|nr:hypothetical protein [Planctomycetota bacterium]
MNDDAETPAPDPQEQKGPLVSRPSRRNTFSSPLNLGPLDRPIDFGDWREFFSVRGGSILYCLSAMCVLYGFAAILGPVFARSFQLVETLPCIVGLNVYEIALLAVLVVIVVWQDVTDDAISLVVLGAIFLVVSGIALTTTSNSDPRSVLLIGAGCLVLAMGKLFVLRRFVGMNIGPVLFAGIAVVLAWNFLAGARFAEAVANDRLVKGIASAKWVQSWIVLLAGALVVLADAMLRGRRPADATDARLPFLRRPAMGWVFAFVLLASAGVHQY